MLATPDQTMMDNKPAQAPARPGKDDFAANNSLAAMPTPTTSHLNDAHSNGVPTRVNKTPASKPGKPKSRKLAPSTAEMNALITLFNQELYAETAAAAIALTVEYPQHGFGWKVLGASLQQQEGRMAEATQALVRAVKLLPGDAEVHYNLGNCYYNQKQLPQARASYQQAVKLNPRFAQAHSNLGNIFKELAHHTESELAYKKALALEPANVLVRVNLAQLFRDQGKLKEAESAYLAVLELDDSLSEAYYSLSGIYEKTGQADKAMLYIQKTIELKPDSIDAYLRLATQLKAQAKDEEAREVYRKILSFDQNAGAHNNLGQLFLESHQLEDAIACFRSAIAIDDRFSAAYNNLGIALKQSGHFFEAKAILQQALAFNPHSAESLNNLGIIIKEEGDYKQAERLYRQALEINPEYVPALCNLGMVLDSQERYAEAEASLRQAVLLKPDFHEGYNNLGLVFKKQDRLNEAVNCFKQSMAIKSDHTMAYINLGSTLKDQGAMEEAIVYLRKALEIDPYCADAYSNLLFSLNQSEHVDASTLFAEHKLYGERFEAEFKPWPPNLNDKQADRPLKIGFVSADFRNHAVAFFIEPVLQYLALSPNLSLYAYVNSVNYDQVSHRLRQHFHHWEQVTNLSHGELADKVRADGIDILVDLSGHTAGHRLLSFARKPAPIQASWLGYLTTTGLTAMDYYFTDSGWMPSGMLDDQFTEKLVQLPAYAPFQPQAETPPVNPLPALSNGYLTFGSFNRVSKLSKTVIALWAEILRQLPAAKMLVGAMAVDGDKETVMAWFADEGIASERIIYHGRSRMDQYLALHQQVDICLDSFPHNGGTTTWHAVWMGVPTLTLAGTMPQSRIGASILGQVGLDDFIVSEKEHYLEQAIYWSQHLPALAAIRSSLRERFTHSPAGQPAIIAQGMEQAFRTMWQRWCNDEAPSALTVEVDDFSLATKKGYVMQTELQENQQQVVKFSMQSAPSAIAMAATVNQPSDVDAALDNAIQEVLEQALAYQQAGELADAEQLCQEVLKIQPLHAAANHRLGVLEVHMQGAAVGIIRLEQAVKADPQNEQYWVSYIDAMVMGGNIDGAASAIELGMEFGLSAATAELLATSFVQEMEQKLHAQPLEHISPEPQNSLAVIQSALDGAENAMPADVAKPLAANRREVGVAKFLVVAPSYTDKSGGIVMLHELCNSLNKLGYLAAMAFFDGAKLIVSDNVQLYGPGLQWHALKDADEFQEFIECGVVIYPEIISGNPLHAKHVVRYMLNTESYVTGNKMDASADDFILSFSSFYHDHPHALLTKVPLNPVFNMHNTVDAMQRTLDVTYIGKGYSRNNCFILPNTLEVTREWPKNKAELALLFKQTRYFFTWDLRSQTNADAALCGAIPVFLSSLPFASFEDMSDEEMAKQIRTTVSIENEQVSVHIPDDYPYKIQKYIQSYMNAVNTYESECVTVVKQILHHFSIPDIIMADDLEKIEESMTA